MNPLNRQHAIREYELLVDDNAFVNAAAEDSRGPESWFNTPEKVSLLQFRAEHWIGTPFFPNSNTAGKRGGVSCQKLASALYKETGFASIEVPEVAMSHARFAGADSLVEKWMDGRPEFVRVSPKEPQPGDLLGFMINRVVHHLGVMVLMQDSPKQAVPALRVFIHTLEHSGTNYATLFDPVWGSRLAVVWRPRLDKGGLHGV
ncbi:MAG TPA: hypothetical protein VLT16_00610 [Candidatus Limnocylindrales bacterium]|nr:hypothetical protein [Candidatus Limnocylindrales bacterium]